MNRGLVLALVAPLSASCSQKMYISSSLEREILLRKPYAANQRGEIIDMHFFANDDRNTISPNCHLMVLPCMTILRIYDRNTIELDYEYDTIWELFYDKYRMLVFEVL